MRMSAGRLNRRVTFERAEITHNELNEPVRTWLVLACNVPAAREDVSDSELIAAGALGASLGARFTIRRDRVSETIKPADRLSHDGVYWNIQAVREKKSDPMRFLEIRATREV